MSMSNATVDQVINLKFNLLCHKSIILVFLAVEGTTAMIVLPGVSICMALSISVGIWICYCDISEYYFFVLEMVEFGNFSFVI